MEPNMKLILGRLTAKLFRLNIMLDLLLSPCRIEWDILLKMPGLESSPFKG
jgi:hypothetical protein